MTRGGAVVVAHDVTEHKAQEAKIADMARFDKLTGLPNRSHLEERLADALALSERGGEPFAVAAPYEIEFHTVVIGMSAGVAISPSDGRTRDEILRAADLAPYKK